MKQYLRITSNALQGPRQINHVGHLSAPPGADIAEVVRYMVFNPACVTTVVGRRFVLNYVDMVLQPQGLNPKIALEALQFQVGAEAPSDSYMRWSLPMAFVRRPLIVHSSVIDDYEFTDALPLLAGRDLLADLGCTIDMVQGLVSFAAVGTDVL